MNGPFQQQMIGYQMPDGSYLFSEDAAARCAMAWAIEAIQEFNKVSEKLDRIEKMLSKPKRLRK